MSTASLLRVAALGTTSTCLLRTAAGPLRPASAWLLSPSSTVAAASASLFAYPALLAGFSTSSARSSEHKEETFEEFTSR